MTSPIVSGAERLGEVVARLVRRRARRDEQLAGFADEGLPAAAAARGLGREDLAADLRDQAIEDLDELLALAPAAVALASAAERLHASDYYAKTTQARDASYELKAALDELARATTVSADAANTTRQTETPGGSAAMAEWLRAGYTEQSARRWTAAGIGTPGLAAVWAEQGFTPENAAAWTAVEGMTPSEAMAAVNAGRAPIDVERVRRADPGWTRPADPVVAAPDMGPWL